jgi:hypothetical protein
MDLTSLSSVKNSEVFHPCPFAAPAQSAGHAVALSLPALSRLDKPEALSLSNEPVEWVEWAKAGGKKDQDCLFGFETSGCYEGMFVSLRKNPLFQRIYTGQKIASLILPSAPASTGRDFSSFFSKKVRRLPGGLPVVCLCRPALFPSQANRDAPSAAEVHVDAEACIRRRKAAHPLRKFENTT